MITVRHATRRTTANETKARGTSMHSRLLKTALIAACALAPLAAAPIGPAIAQAVVSPAQDIVLSIRRGQLVTVPSNLADLFVANEAAADVRVKSHLALDDVGRAAGETSVD